MFGAVAVPTGRLEDHNEHPEKEAGSPLSAAPAKRDGMTARQFVARLSAIRSRAELETVPRFFRDRNAENRLLGVRMSGVFAPAKESVGMSLKEIGDFLKVSFTKREWEQ
jgi:hypothetical protein